MLSVAVSAILFIGCQNQDRKKLVTAEDLLVKFNENGEIQHVIAGINELEIPLTGSWKMGGCTRTGIEISREKQTLTISKTWLYKSREFVTTETISPRKNSINWKITIRDDNDGLWSVPIQTSFHYPAGEETSYWTAWSDPRQGSYLEMSREELIEKGIVPDAIKVNDWADPLISIPFQNAKLWYGEEPYSLDIKWRMFGIRNEEKYITSIPVISVFEEEKDLGLSFVQSFDDVLLNVSIETSEEGKIIFSRENYRMGEGIEHSFSMDMIVHDGGLLSGLKGVVECYPEYFEPSRPEAREMEGTFCYSRNWGDFDKEKMDRMGFKAFWKASHDLPWMGMFIPPVDEKETWKGFERSKGDDNDLVSVPKMRRFSEEMVASGYRVLNYMNVCEFGAYIDTIPPEGIDNIPEKELWKDPNAYVYRKLNDAIVRRTWRAPSAGKPYKFWSWRGCIALDCGIPSYRDFLVGQVKRHIKEFPASSGFNVDRTDWLRLYNLDSDDGISWFENQPVRSLNISYNELMDILWPILLEHNKYWFLDPNGARIDMMNRADGIMQEINEGQVLNCNAIMCINKPFSAWMHERQMVGKSNEEREVWFQNYLYLGIWPMAPFPDNDHSLRPDPEIEKVYFDYTPLFKTLYGKEWVLESHALRKNKEAMINLFKTDLGYVIPVVYARKGKERVLVEIKKEYVEGRTIKIILPGSDVPLSSDYTMAGDYAQINVPVSRRCAMVVCR